jgi:hypothetical protein
LFIENFDGITISEGDEINMSVTATSTTSGVASVKNLSNGQSVTHTFTGMTVGPLCKVNAEWIVEDFDQCKADLTGCTEVPFANFGTVEFTSASAVQNGKTVSLNGATDINMVTTGGASRATCSSSSSTVTCKYT